MLAILAAATLMITPTEWLKPATASDRRPTCMTEAVDPHTGYTACLYWGHAERYLKVHSSKANPSAGAPSNDMAGMVMNVEKARRDAISTAAAATPSGGCVVGVIDPEGDFLCAQKKP